MRGRAPSVVLVLGLAVAALVGASEIEVEEVELAGGGWGWQITAPAIVDAATWCDGDRCGVVLLIGDPLEESDGPGEASRSGAERRQERLPGRALIWLPLEAAMPHTRLDLPTGARAVAALDLDGDRRDELLLETGRGLDAVVWRDGGPSVAELVEEPAVELDLVEPLVIEGEGLLPVPAVGRLRLFALGAGGVEQELELVAELDLPVEVERRATGLALRSPAVARVGVEPPIFVAGPQAIDSQRLRSLRIDREADGSWRAEERWSRLDDPERVDEARWATRGDGEVMLVHTLDADRVGIFERKKVRVLLPRADRTRAGSPPVLAEATASRIWQELGSRLLDVDLDGWLDLVVVQREGFDGRELLVDVYRGRDADDGQGLAFERRSHRAKLPESWPQWRLEEDLDGDGRPDLLLLTGSLSLWPAIESSGRRGGLFAEASAWRLGLPGSAADDAGSPTVAIDPPDGAPPPEIDEPEEERASLRWRLAEVVDVDLDGRPEVVLRASSPEGDRLLVVRPPRRDSPGR